MRARRNLFGPVVIVEVQSVVCVTDGKHHTKYCHLLYVEHLYTCLALDAVPNPQVNPDVKLIYMTTHAIDETKYFGEWLQALKGFEERDPKYLDACKSEVCAVSAYKHVLQYKMARTST